VNAVTPLEVGVMGVNIPPPAVYDPEFATSFTGVYAVVAAVKDALLSYKASLKTSPVAKRKSWTPSISCTLKLVHMKFPVKAILIS
jgi:hypothetical protein